MNKKIAADQDYILTYYQAIVDGTETVGHWIRDWSSLGATIYTLAPYSPSIYIM